MYKVRKKALFVCSTLLCCIFGGFTHASGTMQKKTYPTIQSFKELMPAIDQTLQQHKPEDVLVLLDVDTLLKSKDPAFRSYNIARYRETLTALMNCLEQAEQDELFSEILIRQPMSLVDIHAPKTLQTLKGKGISTFALTAAPIGSIVSDTPIRRIYRGFLVSHGLNLTPLLASRSFVVFNELPRYRGEYPIFYHGLIIANQVYELETKPSVLTGMLSRLTKMPQVVFYISQRRGDLLAVHKKILSLIPQARFVGMQYKDAVAFLTKDDFLGAWDRVKISIQRKIMDKN